MEIDFKAPGRHDDLISISTMPESVGGASFTLRQQALRAADNKLLVDAVVTLACVNTALKAKRIPVEVRHLLEAAMPMPKN
jgi:acyl-CoA thioester hydrolase